MNMITLHDASRTEATFLSNIFIDEYMLEANGEFVKVMIWKVDVQGTSCTHRLSGAR